MEGSYNVIPIERKGAKTDPLNYKPVKLLPIISSKMMESII